ncbi:MAG: HIT domain-containing protein [Armatimonadetes bacterium]|nr:HIT domain-containing protein [Armatimonadota bacterium]
MDHLWAPWRMEYVVTADAQDGCIFCTKPGEECDQANGILARGRYNYVILNAFPYNSGHLMIVPYAHERDFTSLAAEVLAEMFVLAQVAVAVLQEVLHAEAANLGMNIGKAAGAGIRDHVHLHVVPRWSGDTNFMAVTAGTRVVPQSLASTWACLAPPMRAAVSARLGTEQDAGADGGQ